MWAVWHGAHLVQGSKQCNKILCTPWSYTSLNHRCTDPVHGCYKCDSNHSPHRYDCHLWSLIDTSLYASLSPWLLPPLCPPLPFILSRSPHLFSLLIASTVSGEGSYLSCCCPWTWFVIPTAPIARHSCWVNSPTLWANTISRLSIVVLLRCGIAIASQFKILHTV